MSRAFMYAVLSGTVQTWKWAYIHSHPGYCYCVNKSRLTVSQLPVHCLCLLTTSTRLFWKRHVCFHKSNSNPIYNSRNNMNRVSNELFRLLCGQVCFLCGVPENCMKELFNFTPSLLCDKNKHSCLLGDNTIYYHHPIQLRAPALHYAVSFFVCCLLLISICSVHLIFLLQTEPPPIAVDILYN